MYAACWLPLFAVYTVLFASNPGVGWSQAARAALAAFLPSALLGVPLFALRPPPPSGPVERVLAVHAARLVVFAIAATALWAGLVALDRLLQGLPAQVDRRVVGFELVLSGIFYAVLASAAQARLNAALLAENAERLAAADALRARAELAALRSQLNPHFVLNALHTLHALVSRDPARAETAIEELGRLLAYGLRLQREDVDEVALSEEWAFVGDYLRIERLRFGDRLNVTLEADEDSLACRLPPFSVQPLVENAVVHAVSPRAVGGTVSVASRRVGTAVEVVVADDGDGVARGSTNGLGLGLRLVEQRLRVLYGGAASLALESGAGGTRAVLRVPQTGTREVA